MADTPKAPKKAAKNKYPNTDEGRATRFRDVAKNRTIKVIKAIRLLRNLRGANYAYTPEQVNIIETSITGELTGALEHLRAPKGAVKADIDIDL